MPRDSYIETIDDLLREIVGKYLRLPPPPEADTTLTMGQMDCLHTVADLGEPTMSEVAAHLHLHPSTVTALVDGLVERGLLERRADQSDRRVIRVVLSPKEQGTRDRFESAMRSRVAELLGDVGDGDLRRIVQGLSIMRDAIRRKLEASARDAGKGREPQA